MPKPSFIATAGMFKHLVRDERMLTRCGVQWDPHQSYGTSWDWKTEENSRSRSSAVKEATNEGRGGLYHISPSFSTNLFAFKVFTRPGSLEGWALHHSRGLCSVMFIAWGLKCRKSLWKHHWSRKEKTSLVPSFRHRLISAHLKQLCLVPILLGAIRLHSSQMNMFPLWLRLSQSRNWTWLYTV